MKKQTLFKRPEPLPGIRKQSLQIAYCEMLHRYEDTKEPDIKEEILKLVREFKHPKTTNYYDLLYKERHNEKYYFKLD